KSADRSKISEVHRPDIFPGHRVAVELVIARIDVVITRDAIAHKKRFRCGMSPRTERWKEIRLERHTCGRHVPSHRFSPYAEATGNKLKIQTKYAFVVVTRNPGGQELLSKLHRSAYRQLLVEELAHPRHIVDLAVVVIEEAITVEHTDKILKILKGGSRQKAQVARQHDSTVPLAR